MKKNKISKNRLTRQNKDPFFRQSKIQGYRSRSAFKLIEMNKKFKFMKSNSSLLDLGSCPGGWSQVARKEIIKGKILAVDIRSMEKINDVVFRIIQSILVMISSFLVIIAIVLVLFLIDPAIALSSFVIFGGTYFVISSIFVKRLIQ